MTKEQRRAYYKRYYEKNKVKLNARKVEYRKRNPHMVSKWNRSLKIRTLNQYGGDCECCGETNPSFLTIDHIDGNGAGHRRDNNVHTGSQFYYWLKRNNYPMGFQVLCFNCNVAKHIEGSCPHKKEV